MIRREVEFPVSPAQLWEMLTDPRAVSAWLGSTVEWRPEPGASARFTGDEGGDRHGRIEEVVAERRLRFSWWREHRVDERSEVEFLLEPADIGVRLVVTERQVKSKARPQASAAASWGAWDGRLVGMCAVVSPASSAVLGTR